MDGQIDTACDAAAEAFASSAEFDPAELLDGIAARIADAENSLVSAAHSETSLTTTRLAGEIARTTSQLRAFAAECRRSAYLEPILDVPTETDPDRIDLRRINVPIGPVAVWAASNFPFAFSVAGGDTASAFAAGCPVVLKAHPAHPRTSELTGALVTEAVAASGAPAGWFTLVQADSVEDSLALAQHPAIAAIAFTGSLRAGRALYDAAASRPVPIPVYAEMGSLNPLVITPSAARRDDLPAGLAGSITGSAGQLCTKPGLVFMLDDAATDAFVTALADEVGHAPSQRMLTMTMQDGFRRQVAQSVANTAAVTLGADLADDGDEQQPVLAHIDSADFRDAPELAEEHFGPFALIVRYTDDDDLLRTLAVLPPSLTATVHTGDDDDALAARILTVLQPRAGRVIFNGFPTGVPIGWATVHGGPYPATTAAATTSVGLSAARRFLRPVAFQNAPAALLPAALADANPLGLLRVVNGALTDRGW